jgi:hypothetical protein
MPAVRAPPQPPRRPLAEAEADADVVDDEEEEDAVAEGVLDLEAIAEEEEDSAEGEADEESMTTISATTGEVLNDFETSVELDDSGSTTRKSNKNEHHNLI